MRKPGKFADCSTGFTLLELILVVIIVGMLVSLALPRYNEVIEKSRASEGVGILGYIYRAQLRYYASHNYYSDFCSDLDIEIGSETRYFYTIKCINDPTRVGEIYRNGAPVWTYTLRINKDGRVCCCCGPPGNCGVTGCPIC